jgi:putative redox protein
MSHDHPGSVDELRADMKVGVHWSGDQRFSAGRKGGPSALLDGRSKEGLSPPEALLSSLASCTAIDVIEILTKRRTPPKSVEIDVTAERAHGTPRRVTKVHLAYRIAGAIGDRVHAERAIELAVTKYCTVRDSLDPKIPVTWSLELHET